MFSAIRQAIFILLLAAAGAWATHEWHPRAPALYLVQEPLRDDEVSMAVIQSRWQGRVLWIDARYQEQYDEGHIPGAVLLNEQHFDQQLFGLLDTLQTNKLPIIVYCSAAKCDPGAPEADAAGGESLCPQRRVECVEAGCKEGIGCSYCLFQD
jgi:Rhodanese-like domain